MLKFKNGMAYYKKCPTTNVPTLMKLYDYIIKMKMKLKNRSHKYYINRPRTSVMMDLKM